VCFKLQATARMVVSLGTQLNVSHNMCRKQIIGHWQGVTHVLQSYYFREITGSVIIFYRCLEHELSDHILSCMLKFVIKP
jgi:hypothetical protein